MSEPAWRRRFKAPRFTFPTWARDRPAHVLYGSNHEGTFEVYALDVATGTHRRLTSRPEGTGYRVPSRLEPSGRAVWWWDDDRGNELGTWRAQPFEGGASRPATDLAPAYSAGCVIGDGFAVVGSSTEQGSAIHLVGEGGSALLYEHREHARVESLSADDSLVALTHSEHGDSRNPAVRVIDRRGATVRELWDGPGKGLEPGRWSPVRGDARLLVEHERAGARRPLVLDVATSVEREIALDLPGETAADWYPDGSALLISHDHRGRGELYRYELARATLERLATASGTVDAARVRPDGDVWYALSSSAEPRAVRALGGARMLPPETTDIPGGVAYREIDVGFVHAFVVTPAATGPGAAQGPRGAGGPWPTIFIVHGGPEAHDKDAFSATVQAWVDHGYAVALVNYRGSSGYGKAWRDAITGRPGLTELDDLAAVHDRLVADGVADPRRTILSGGSWGGYLTLLGLGTQPSRWALGIAGVPIGDYVAAFEDEMEPLKRYDAALFGGTPAEVPDVYMERNPIAFVDRVRVPVMLLVGENDPRCPSRSAYLYVHRLRALAKPFELYRYDAGHGSMRLEEQLRQLEAELAFAARHLGTTPPIA